MTTSSSPEGWTRYDILRYQNLRKSQAEAAALLETDTASIEGTESHDYVPTLSELLADHSASINEVVSSSNAANPAELLQQLLQLYTIETVFLKSISDLLRQYSMSAVTPEDSAQWSALCKMWDTLHLATFLPDNVQGGKGAD